MKTKCQKCVYLNDDNTCKNNILEKLKSKVSIENNKPIISNYKCMYAFPVIQPDSDKDITAESIEKMRIDQFPLINCDLVFNFFDTKISNTSIKKHIGSILNGLVGQNNIRLTKIILILSSEKENKQELLDYLDSNEFKTLHNHTKWKICSMQVNINESHRFLFATDNSEANFFLYCDINTKTETINKILNKVTDQVIVHQKPLIACCVKDCDFITSFIPGLYNNQNFRMAKKYHATQSRSIQDIDFTKYIMSMAMSDNKELFIDVDE